MDNDAGQYEAGRPAGLTLANGTISLSFVADAPDDGSYQVLFSKDGSSNAAGDISCFLYDGHLYVQMQDGTTTTWLEARDHVIEAGVAYDLAVSFGANGLRISLNGELVALDQEWTTGLSGNARSLLIGAGNWGRDGTNPTATWNHFDGTITNFAIYDRALDAFEIDALSSAPHLSGPSIGAAALAGALPAARAGTGLAGEVFDRAVAFDDIDALIAQTQTQAAANRHFTASRVDFDSAAHDATTLGAFLGDAATLTDGGATTAMTTLGLRLTGFVHLSAGEHLVTVRSDDGFLLKIGGQVVSSYDWDRGFSGTTQSVVSTGGLYAVELYYFDNQGDQGLRLEIDGELAGPELFYRSLADYEAALAANGAAPAGGLPPVYDGPLGTTGTGLDATIRVIGEDQGLAHRVSRADIAAGAAAAAINGMIVEAIRATGAANDGVLTTAEVYDLSTYIRAHHYAAFLAAHGDDETGVETGYHLVQNDGATTRLYGENAINTVFDGIYHIGFETEWDRFLNEDGNANARVETVAYWLNDLLKTDLANGTLKNASVDPLPNGSTGTGLDAAVDLIGSDYGLNARVPGSHLSGGMASADAMNALIVQAIRATGVASDGTLTTSDVYAINGWIRANALSTWTALHGDDENGVETGYHMVQNDGAVTRLFAHNAVDTVLDGVYHPRLRHPRRPLPQRGRRRQRQRRGRGDMAELVPERRSGRRNARQRRRRSAGPRRERHGPRPASSRRSSTTRASTPNSRIRRSTPARPPPTR
ncbi:MAG: hypothetical protein IPL88_10645 [Rhizobiales bacterium]|nr:hypothetical protein [Hyphomicrobiales bacterium]